MKLDEFNSVQIHQSRYRELLAAEAEISSIREQRAQEIKMHRLLSRDGYFDAIFETKDGLMCLEQKNDCADANPRVVLRACKITPSALNFEPADRFTTNNIRTYRRSEEYIMGIPIYREE